MVKERRLTGVKIKSDSVCDVCATAKQVRKTFNMRKEDSDRRESSHSDAVVCSDVLSPMTPASKSEFKYILTFIMMKVGTSQYTRYGRRVKC